MDLWRNGFVDNGFVENRFCGEGQGDRSAKVGDEGDRSAGRDCEV